MLILYHFVLSLFWRFLLLLSLPFLLVGWVEPAVWCGYYVLLHDEQWMYKQG